MAAVDRSSSGTWPGVELLARAGRVDGAVRALEALERAPTGPEQRDLRRRRAELRSA